MTYVRLNPLNIFRLKIKKKLVKPINFTYSEDRSVPKFNWFKALEKANSLKANNSLPESFSDELCKKANSWVTCACGNQCSMIPRSGFDGKPSDETLAKLGLQFSRIIDREEYITAKLILEDIEKRSSFLIKEILKEKI